MLKQHTIWITFAAYLLFLIGVAFWEQRRQRAYSARSFLTAGGSISWPVLVMTYLASLMSTWVFFAGPGGYYRGGLGYWISELISIGQAAQVATGGAADYRAVICIVGAAIILYVCLGGMKSVALTDTIQGLLFISLLWIIAAACLYAGFGGSVSAAFTSIWENSRDWLSYPGPDGWVPYGARLGYPLSYAIGWTIMLPHVFVRSGYSGKDMHTQRKLMILTPILQAVVWTGTMVIGLVGVALLPGLPTSDTELIIPYMIQNVIQSIHPTLALVLMLAFFIGASAVGMLGSTVTMIAVSLLTQPAPQDSAAFYTALDSTIEDFYAIEE